MENTANLKLPYIMPSQAQKHVTHNEALAIIDAVVQLSVRDRDLKVPPDHPEEGDRYVVGADASGIWEGWDEAIALWADGGWRRVDARPGWLAWVEDEAVMVRRTAAGGWTVLGDSAGTSHEFQMLGVGATADAENPFVAKLNKALWTARYDDEGGDGDLRYTLNKQEPASVLSLLLQSDWSGRAELGLIGDDDLTIKVSPDGANWKEAIRIDRDTGAASFPNTALLTIVGTVSQSGGVPTGAIMERGENGNGKYIRFADGTQLCWHRAASPVTTNVALAAPIFVSPGTGVEIFTFPAAFVATPEVGTATSRPGSGTLGWGLADQTTATGTLVRVFSYSNAAGGTVPGYVAAGRWF